MNSALAFTHVDKARPFWAQHREASLNWLALGLLLAAWNVSTDEPRPKHLQCYACVSVRAVQRFVCTSHKNVNTL